MKGTGIALAVRPGAEPLAGLPPSMDALSQRFAQSGCREDRLPIDLSAEAAQEICRAWAVRIRHRRASVHAGETIEQVALGTCHPQQTGCQFRPIRLQFPLHQT